MAAPLERLDRLFSRLGYGSRAELRDWLRAERVRVGPELARKAGERVDPALVRIDGEPLDHPNGLYLLYHKPLGKVCAHGEPRSIYTDFPASWSVRRPAINSVGRLDADTSGTLLVTDDGAWLHRWTHPRRAVPRVYLVGLAEPVDDALLAPLRSGELLLDGETSPCLPATVEVQSPQHLRLTLREGRYHEVRRMMAALGNRVETLHREAFGPFRVDDLQPGRWRLLAPDERILP
ncbi:MAG: pseudouridine synthase [Acidithiobacillus sp.]